MNKKKINKNEGDPDFTYHDLELKGFKWKQQPGNPDAILTTNDGEIYTKQEFWDNDIIGIAPEDINPDYAKKEEKVWNFGYHAGYGISGFVEDEDFTFGK